jgi:hypothetical protein
LYLKTKFFICLFLIPHSFCRALFLATPSGRKKALALNNLRSEVIELRNEGLEKDKILNSLINKIKEDEATSKAQSETQKCEIEDLRKQLAEEKLKCAITEADRDASDYWKNHWEK